VGTGRRLIAAQAEGHTFLAPDNGLLTPILEKDTLEDIRLIDRREWYLPHVSNTFHGRDIFAPVAAHLAGGRPFQRIGPPIDPASCILLKGLQARFSDDGSIHGTILYVDRFGNLVTNVTQEDIERLSASGEHLVIRIGGHQIEGLQRSYGLAPKDSPLALIGSRERLEIAICCGNAAQKLGVAPPAPVTIQRGKQD
jgi:S-adenosylmethionine hydrolase